MRACACLYGWVDGCACVRACLCVGISMSGRRQPHRPHGQARGPTTVGMAGRDAGSAPALPYTVWMAADAVHSCLA
jgi:hypothetical protein